MAVVSPETRDAVAAALLPEVLARQGEVWVREASASMHPLIRPGDLVLLRALSSHAPLAFGGLLAYRRGDRLVVHRLVGRDGPVLLVKGDALDMVERVSRGQTIAHVAAVRRPTGRLADFERFPWPWFHRLLGVVARLAERWSPSRPAALRRVFRIPFHAAALMLR